MRPFKIIIIIALLTAIPFSVQAKVIIFACEPEWASLAEEIGGSHVKTYSATSARQDPHYIRARPSLIAKVRRADLLICSGAGLEVGWLPLLLQKASAKVQPGSPGHLMAAEIVQLLEQPIAIDRSMGDVHPEGNPHVHLNPHNVSLIAKTLADRLARIDVEHAEMYQERYQRFSQRWQKAILNWESQAQKLKNMPVVVHHRSFSYLLHWLGIEAVASLEPKPGIPPTTSHLEKLLQQLKKEQANMIIRTPYDPDNASQWLSNKTGMKSIALPYTVGGDKQSGDLFELFDRTITLMTDVYNDQR